MLNTDNNKKFDATVRDYGNITLSDLPLDEQVVISSLPEKQEKLEAYEQAYKNVKPAKNHF